MKVEKQRVLPLDLITLHDVLINFCLDSISYVLILSSALYEEISRRICRRTATFLRNLQLPATINADEAFSLDREARRLHEHIPVHTRTSLYNARAGNSFAMMSNSQEHSPSPLPLMPSTSTVESIVFSVTSDPPSRTSHLGTTVLSIAVGGVAAFIIVPALAVLAFLYIRRWRRTHGNTTYNSIASDNDEDEDDDIGPLSRSGRKYHDEIQLKDYENEGKPSFEEAGPLVTPMSAVHVMPAAPNSSSYTTSEGKSEALGSTTIKSAQRQPFCSASTFET